MMAKNRKAERLLLGIKKQRNLVLENLNKSLDVMEITMRQMENHFCGNIFRQRKNPD
jgi:hypothetical protein